MGAHRTTRRALTVAVGKRGTWGAIGLAILARCVCHCRCGRRGGGAAMAAYDDHTGVDLCRGVWSLTCIGRWPPIPQPRLRSLGSSSLCLRVSTTS